MVNLSSSEIRCAESRALYEWDPSSFQVLFVGYNILQINHDEIMTAYRGTRVQQHMAQMREVAAKQTEMLQSTKRTKETKYNQITPAEISKTDNLDGLQDLSRKRGFHETKAKAKMAINNLIH